MKPRNFPERKRQRQIGALKRIKNRLATKVYQLTQNRDKAVAEADTLTLVIANGNQRSRRTKKNRVKV